MIGQAQQVASLYAKIGADVSGLQHGLSTAGRDMSGFGSKLASLAPLAGMALAAVGVAAIGAGVAIVTMAAQFDQGMRRTNSMLLMGKEEFKAFKDQALDVANKVGIGTDQMAKGIYQAISASVPRENVFQFMEVASKAAIGGTTDLLVAVDGLTTVLNAYKMSTSEVGHVSDVLFTTVARGKTTFDELARSLFNILPIAAAVGVKFYEVAAAIATLTKSGTPTSVATTQLRAVLNAIIKPTKEMTDGINSATYAYLKQQPVLTDSQQGWLKATDRITVLNKAIVASERSAKGAGVATQDFSLAMRGLQDELDGVKASVDVAKAALDAGKERLKAITDSVSALSSKLQEAHNRLRDLTAPKLVGMGALDDQIFDLTQSANKLKLALVGMDPKEDVTQNLRGQLDAINDQIERLQLSKDIQFAPELRKIAKAASEAGRELSFSEAMDDINNTKLEIARLGQELLDMQKKVGPATDEVNVLAEGVVAANAPVAALEQAIKALTRASEDSARASSAANAGMSAQADATQAMRDELEDLTLKQDEYQVATGESIIKALGFKGVLDALVLSTDGNQKKLAAMFGSVEALGAVFGLTGEAGDIFAADLKAAMESAQGDASATDEAYKVMKEGVVGHWEDIRVKMETLAIKIGDKVMPAVEKLMDKFLEREPQISAFILKLTNFMDKIIDAGDFLGKLMPPAGFNAPPSLLDPSRWESGGRAGGASATGGGQTAPSINIQNVHLRDRTEIAWFDAALTAKIGGRANMSARFGSLAP